MPDSATVGGPAQVTLDQAALDAAAGGAFAQRGRLVTLPACALTTPQVPACTVQTPLATHVDAATKRVVADVTLPSGAKSVAAAAGRSAMASPQALNAASAPMIVAATNTASGGGGDYKASSLAPSAGWAAGNSNGGLTYNYGIQVPAPLGGAAPSVALSYNSSSVDGKTSATNSQSSWIGDGWDYTPGFIERTYRACDKHGITGSGDECWAGNNATLSFGSHSGPLVHDDSSGVWRLKNDDGTKVEFLSGANNGANNGDYVKLTDTSGTVYYFGANYLPKADGGMQTMGAASNSVSTVPVYSPSSTDPCYNSSQGAASWCQMAYRWALDFVIDPHGNLITYTYKPETGYYARGGGQNNGNGTTTAYTRANLLSQISYNQRQDEQLAAGDSLQPAARVLFRADTERCLPDSGFTCDPSLRTAANADRWYDTPVDQECQASGTCTHYSPTFFTTKRLASIATQVRKNNVWWIIDTWTLTQTFPDPLDTTSQRTLWLNSIQREGNTTGPDISLPSINFTPVMLPNRVDGIATAANGAAFPDIRRPRIQQIQTETGAVLLVDYNLPGCSRLNHVMPTSEDDNSMSCFPVKWTPPGAVAGTDPILDWFNHYTVSALTTDDPTTSANDGEYTASKTAYSYGKPGWHRDDSEFTETNARTWGDFRGYGTVTTITGNGNDGPKGRTTTTYLQGLDGDKTKGAPRSVQLTDALKEKVTDDDWLAGQVLQTDTYAQDEAKPTDLKIVASTVNRTLNPYTTGTHAKTGSTALDVPQVARYTGTTMVATALALKTDGTWRTNTKTSTLDPSHGNRAKTVLDQADGLPDLCTRTDYATGPDTQRVDLTDRVTTISGQGACSATPAASNTVSDSKILFDGLAFGKAAATANPTSTQILDSYDSSGNPHFTPQTGTTFDRYGRTVTATALTSTDSQHPGGATATTTYTPAATGEQPATVTMSAPIPGASSGTWDTTTTFDVRRGDMLTSTDPNGKTVKQVTDSLGRTVALWSAGRTASANANQTFTYTLDPNHALPPYVTTKTLTMDSSAPTYVTSVQINDGLGRARQTQSDPSASGYTGRLISDTYYDSQGRAYKTNTPWYNDLIHPSGTLVVPKTTPVEGDATVPGQTLKTFDGLGRTVSTSFRAKNSIQWTTTTAYPGVDRTDVTRPGGTAPSSTFTDARGRTTELWQYNTPTPTGNAGDATVTRYTYRSDGKPATRTDAAGNTWSYGYDQLGHQISSTDPDTGTTTQTYDAAGRVTTTTDARNQTLAYTYDLLGRKTGEYNGSISAGNQLAGWTYDDIAKGKPTSSTRYTAGASGPAYTKAVTGYDDAYRATGTKYTLPGSEFGQTDPYTYSTTSGFDPVTGNLNYTIMPAVGGLPYEPLSYKYGSYGLLTDYKGVVTYDLNTDYDAYGRPDRTTLNPWGTQVVVSTDYDQNTGQVLRDYVDQQTNQQGQTQITGYTYNTAGQITSISTTPDNTPSARDRECFTYDRLGRLTTAWTDTGDITHPPAIPFSVLSQGACANATPTSGAVPPAKTTVSKGGNPYWQEYRYDLTGNRTTLIQHDPAGDTTKDITTTQTFGQGPNTKTSSPNPDSGTGGPHALLTSSVQTGSGTPAVSKSQYDTAGNTAFVTDPGEFTTLLWDRENKLETVDKRTQPGNTHYVYDADGTQLIRRYAGKSTYFFGADEITVDNNVKPKGITATRYYPMPNGITDVRVDGGDLVAQIADHHGTGTLSIDLSTNTKTRRPVDPFGNPRGTQPAQGTWSGDKGFVGGTKDDTAGYTNLGARAYDTIHGRFISPDPLLDTADPQQWNGYAYSSNDPVNLSDPSGLMGCRSSDECDGGTQLGMNTPSREGLSTTATATNGHDADGTGHQARGTRSDGTCCRIQKVLVYPGVAIPENWDKGADFTDALYSRMQDFCKGDWGKKSCPYTNPDYPVQGYSLQITVMGACDDIGKDNCPSDVFNLSSLVLAGLADGMLVGNEGPVGMRGRLSAGAPEGKLAGVPGMGSMPVRGGACRNSFPAGTQVLLADGTYKSIENLKDGDVVLATDPQTGDTRGHEVTATIRTPDDKGFTTLTIRGLDGADQTLTSTDHHPFWSETRHMWLDAASLRAGERLRASSGATAEVISLVHHDWTMVAYNLTVADVHTYYVLAGETPVLVHNSDQNPWDNAIEWEKGHLPETGGPKNGILYKRYPDAGGALTGWGVYDESGNLTYRVDLFGAAHKGVETPHWQPYKTNVAPNGKVYVNKTPDAFPGTGPAGGPPVGCPF
ncbi:hypothetical protein CFP65_1037 [Kitasatospora sp. MMS16-BH015]|nr:hypothetical protein CFP65_1037 [Kitasatospora sp. MMS16-BH015]